MSIAIVQDAVLLDSYVLEVTALVALLKQMQTSIKKFDTAIAETSRQHPCWAIAQSLPGAGPVMAPRLLAAMGNGKQWEIPESFYPTIEQSVVILKSAKDKSASQDFVRFVTEGRGRGILEKGGFQLPDNTRRPTGHK